MCLELRNTRQARPFRVADDLAAHMMPAPQLPPMFGLLLVHDFSSDLAVDDHQRQAKSLPTLSLAIGLMLSRRW